MLEEIDGQPIKVLASTGAYKYIARVNIYARTYVPKPLHGTYEATCKITIKNKILSPIWC